MIQNVASLPNNTKMLQIYTKSLESELQSYIHFRNYLSTNNSTENELSSKFLDDAFKFEIDSFKALKSSGMFRIVP